MTAWPCFCTLKRWTGVQIAGVQGLQPGRPVLKCKGPCREAENEALNDIDTGAALTHCHMLNAFDSQQGHHNTDSLRVTAFSWHPSGLVVSVVYGVAPKPGYCTATGLFCQWSFGRSAVTPAHPQARIVTDCALQAVACNQHFPALVAAGSANGGIYVWDMTSDEDDRCVGRSNTATRDVGHQQGVVSIEWVYSGEESKRFSERAKALLICSVGRCATSLLSSLCAFFAVQAALKCSADVFRLQMMCDLRATSGAHSGELAYVSMQIWHMFVCRGGRVLLWRWHDCSQPVFGLRVVDSSQQTPMPLCCAAFLRQNTSRSVVPAVARLAVCLFPANDKMPHTLCTAVYCTTGSVVSSLGRTCAVEQCLFASRGWRFVDCACLGGQCESACLAKSKD